MKKIEDKQDKTHIFRRKAYNFGNRDLILNFIFALATLGGLFTVLYPVPPSTSSEWALGLFVTIIPFLFFSARAITLIFYHRDFVSVDKDGYITYRSTPLLSTGFLKVKRGNFHITEIRNYGMGRLPRKMSLDLWKFKDKAIIIFTQKSGPEIIIGEYLDNQSLADICLYIKSIYPRAKLKTNIGQKFPYLEKNIDEKERIVEIKEELPDPEGAEFRRM